MSSREAKNNPDLFAQIATSLSSERHSQLEEPALEKCPDNLLGLVKGDPGTQRPRFSRWKSAEEVQQALAELKGRMRPFLLDHAPELPSLRSVQRLRSFQWRIEEPEDRRAFENVQAGAGLWESVTVPHYGPPLGVATTLYRRLFTPTGELLEHPRQILCFGAVDYTCEVYLNGVCLRTHEGIFEPFEIDVTDYLLPGENVLLVRVHNDHTMLGEAFNDAFMDGDKVYAATGLGYDDPGEGWHHCPAGMGIWQQVRLEGRSRLAITDTFVRPHPDLNGIDLEIEVTGYGTDGLEKISLELEVFGQNFKTGPLVHDRHHPGGKNVRGFGDLDHATPEFEPALMGRGSNCIRLSLPLESPRLWDLETPWLYQLQVRLLDSDDKLLDTAARQFGMRSFTQETEGDNAPLGRFFLNGREIRLRGANTMGNIDMCVFRGDFEQLHEDILLAKLTHLNFLRLTQHPVQPEVYEACDRLGLLLQTDLPLFATIRSNQFLECVRQAEAMERLVRAHPSSALVSFINEPFPSARAKPHRFIDREQMEVFFQMARMAVRRQNPDRVIKNVDGDYDPPTGEGMPDNHCYCGWYIGHGVDLGYLHHGGWMPVKPGWHYGCGEFGSEGLDPLATMQEFYPAEWLPANGQGDGDWSPDVITRAQSGPFHYLWYPTPRSLEEWIEASQSHQEWITRLMTEAFRRKSGMNTFAIHLFIDAWPAGWMKTIMDVKRTPKPAWFTYRDALTPLAVFLRTDRHSGFGGERLPVEVWLANDLDESPEGLSVWYDVRSGDRLLAHGESPVQARRCAPTALGKIPVDLPEVVERESLEVGITLLREGRAVHESSVTLEVFPALKPVEALVATLPGDDGARKLLLQSGASEVDFCPQANTILIASAEAYYRNKQEVDAAVRAGATALLLNLPVGVHTLGSCRLEVREAGMGPRHFVSLAEGHPLVGDFRPQDFKFWYDEALGYASPILRTVLEAPGWTPILNSGNGDWQNPWCSVPVATEISDGEGCWRVCQVSLENRVRTNPVAHVFLLALLNAGAPQTSPLSSRLTANKVETSIRP
ncbi:glycoside hydrolase family 2 [Ruficoccus amylovorans]|uniref:Glycoside hydrolase family 2 n=1 Tax=Ruficoccus amylovorans TaxID=1804625 RepID=A0A842HFR6_9BACT|nr:sugar-binding domain-containing protein [Ruficoccus amylovorans]MBC2594417.1 glycoside hydrolase family 2 [Ruficoccus amylovorans]